MERKSSSVLICVRMDRCWNRYWRCIMFLTFILLATLIFVFLFSPNNSGPVLQTDWQKHWSQVQDAGKASKQVFQSSGNMVDVKEVMFQEYVANNRDPESDESEYYDRDSPDQERRLSDYVNQYRNDEMVGNQQKIQPGAMGVFPDLHDYSLQDNFKGLFRNSLTETIQFDPNYVNPCWAESIPKLPYHNNSYLKVKEQATVLEPQFQYMRRLFGQRSDPSNRWRLRCLPYFYVMEPPPMAMPRLFNALQFHPSVVNPAMTEPEFWNQRGPDEVATLRDYLDIYDAVSEKIRTNVTNVLQDGNTILLHKLITGDGTGSHLWTVDSWRRLPKNTVESEPQTTVPQLIKQLTPGVKIIMVLRNPTERLFQGYISQTESPSASDFHAKAGQALKSMSDCEKKRGLRTCVYDSFLNKRLQVRLRIGMYYPFVKDWLGTFGRDQVKVIRYEDYVNNPSETINDVCSFLNLSPYPTKDLEAMEAMIRDNERKRKANQKLKMMSTTRAMLKEFHKNLNQELADLLQEQKFTWPELIEDPEQLVLTEAEQKEQDKANPQQEQQQREQQQREQQQREQQQREQQQREQQQREQQQREQQQREQQQREQQREQQQREQQQREQQQKEQQQKEQQQKEQQQREQQQKEQQQREQQQREHKLRYEQLAKEQQLKAQQMREQLQKDLQKNQQSNQQQGQQNQQQGQQNQQQGQQNQQQGQQNQQQGQQNQQQGQQTQQQGQQNQQQGQQIQQQQQQQQQQIQQSQQRRQ